MFSNFLGITSIGIRYIETDVDDKLSGYRDSSYRDMK